MGRKENLLPALIFVVAERDPVFAVPEIIEDCAAYRRAAETVQRCNIELHLRVIIHAADLPVKVFPRPCSVPDVGVTVNVGAEIVGQGQKLFQIL